MRLLMPNRAGANADGRELRFRAAWLGSPLGRTGVAEVRIVAPPPPAGPLGRSVERNMPPLRGFGSVLALSINRSALPGLKNVPWQTKKDFRSSGSPPELSRTNKRFFPGAV